MGLESLEGWSEDDPVEVAFEQFVEFATTEHLAGRRGGDDAVSQSFRLGVVAQRIERLHRDPNVIIKLAAFAADQTMRRAFGAGARFERAIDIIRK
jgi:hypothetical protein